MRRRLEEWMPKGSFLRNVTVLTGGTVFAQALTILTLPILTRLYTPHDFKLLSVYVGLIGILSVASCLRYNIAIPLPEDDKTGFDLLALSLISSVGFSIACSAPIVLAPNLVSALLGQPDLKSYLWLIPFGVMIASMYNALQLWASRKKRFSLITQTRVTRAVGGIGTQLAFGLGSPSPFGLIFGHAIYGGLGVTGLVRNIFKSDNGLFASLRWGGIVAAARDYRRFPLYSVPEALLNTAGTQLPLLVIAAVVAGPEAGFLFLAMRVLALPVDLVGSSVAQVFLSEAPQKLRDGTLPAFTRRTMWTLFKTGAPALLLIAAVAPIAFPIVFGEDWGRAGWLVVWIAPWLILQFVASPVSMLVHVLGRQDVALSLQAFGLAIRMGTVLCASYFWSTHVSEAYAISGAVFYMVYLSTINVLASKPRRGEGL